MVDELKMEGQAAVFIEIEIRYCLPIIITAANQSSYPAYPARRCENIVLTLTTNTDFNKNWELFKKRLSKCLKESSTLSVISNNFYGNPDVPSARGGGIFSGITQCALCYIFL